jgi:hypothetical protein
MPPDDLNRQIADLEAVLADEQQLRGVNAGIHNLPGTAYVSAIGLSGREEVGER